MKQQITEALSRKLGASFHISTQKVLKTNVKLDGLSIMQDGGNIAPTIYLDSFYKDLENGTSIDDVARRILQAYFEAEPYTRHFDHTALAHFSYVKDRLYVELINRHFNAELLHDVPHSLFLDDFAVTVRCMVDAAENDCASFLVHNSHLDWWQTDQETLLSHALRNTREMLGVELRNMKDILEDISPALAGDGSSGLRLPIWVMTNRQHLSGAATVLFDDMLKDFSKKQGSFYVVFSSVHEALLLPTPDDSNIKTITKINQDVNQTSLDAGEVLGTKAYFYHKDHGFIL